MIVKREFVKKNKNEVKVLGFLHNNGQAVSTFAFFPVSVLRGSCSSLVQGDSRVTGWHFWDCEIQVLSVVSTTAM